MKKLFLGISFLIFFGFNANLVHAEEENYSIDLENENRIEDAINREEANQDYINGVIELYHSVKLSSDSEKDFNDYLTHSLDELENHDLIQDSQLETIKQEINQRTKKSEKTIGDRKGIQQSNIIIPDPTLPAYNAAIGTYKAGIAIVDQVGHWQTANYMRHAIVPAEHRFNYDWNPSTYYSRNDEWAKMVDGEELIIQYFNRLKEEAFLGGRKSGSFSGSYQFSGGHLYTSLKTVDYTVTYKQQTNGNYWTQVKITDVFDFEWEARGYDGHFGAGFGNNYAYLVQEAKYIRPYKIEIVNEIAR